MIAERLYGGDGSAAYRKATEEILGYLLGRGGVSLHSLDKKGRNILHILAGTHTGIVDKEKNESEENEETIELASSKNANDVLRRQESRMNLVHILIAKGICRGGGVNVREKENGNSPLHECVAKGDNELLALLCKNGGDVLLRNTQGLSIPLRGDTLNTNPPHQARLPFTLHAAPETWRQLSCCLWPKRERRRCTFSTRNRIHLL